MNKETLAYIAGIMDADGFFTIKRSTYSMRIRGDSRNPTYQERAGLKQVSSYAVDLIHKNYGGYRSIVKPTCKNGKQLYSVNLTCRQAVIFIRAIFPYLKIKRKQANILLRLRKSIEKGRQKISYSYSNNRWGQRVKVKRKSLSKKQVNYRENLIVQLDALNDIRIIKNDWRK